MLDENDQLVKPGQPGELTITTLGVEGMPLLRYKTGDVVSLHDGDCLCGRATLRVSPVKGRKQQMIKLKGTTLYPPGVFEILHQADIADYVVEVFTNDYVQKGLPVNEVKEVSRYFMTYLRSLQDTHRRKSTTASSGRGTVHDEVQRHRRIEERKKTVRSAPLLYA